MHGQKLWIMIDLKLYDMKLKLIISFFLFFSTLGYSKNKEISNSESIDYEISKVFSYDGIIWSIEFLNESDIIFSDKKGKVFTYKGSEIKEINGIPKIYKRGQGGLMDIELHPEFSQNNIIYLSYSKQFGDKGGNTAIAMATLDNQTLTGLKDIFIGKERSTKGVHWGSRMQFDKNSKLYFGIGDRGSRDVNPQDLTKDGGKIYRINDDGSIPSDNPYVNSKDINSAIYSYGHRNPQGIFLHPITNEIWTNEHGPKGGDEVNIISKAKNYGWPIISYGINYNGTSFTDKTQDPNMEQPYYYWVPSIAPSSFEYLSSKLYGDWEGSLLVGSLKFGYLERLLFDSNGKLEIKEKIGEGIGRVRDVKLSPDGYIYLAVEGQGVFKILPK
jgi:glucose/arabinose dehydrogenase